MDGHDNAITPESDRQQILFEVVCFFCPEVTVTIEAVADDDDDDDNIP